MSALEMAENRETLTPTHRSAGETGLARRASLNAVALFLDYGAKIVVGLIVTPILVTTLGKTLFGVWEMLGRLVGYMAATDGRPAEALRMVVANRQYDEDDRAKRRIVGSSLIVWVGFLPLLLATGGCLAWFAPAITGVEASLYAPVRTTCGLLLVNFILLNLVTLPEAVLRGSNQGYKRMGLQAGLSVLAGVFTVAAIRSGAGIIGVAAAQVAISIISGVLFLAIVRRFVSWFGASLPSGEELRQFLRVSLWNLAGALASRAQMSSDVVILGIVASSDAVATYVLTGYPAGMVANVLTLGLMATAPGLGGVIGAGQIEKAARIRGEMLLIAWLFVTVVGSTILLWNRSFVDLWVGAGHYAGPVVNFLLVLVLVQTTYIRIDSSIIDGTLLLKRKALVGGVAAGLTLLLCFLLSRKFGMAGTCVGLILGRSVQSITFPLIVAVHFGGIEKSERLMAIRPVLVTAALFLICGYLGQTWTIHSWIAWSVGVSSSFAAICWGALAVGLPISRRRVILNRLRQVVWKSSTGTGR